GTLGAFSTCARQPQPGPAGDMDIYDGGDAWKNHTAFGESTASPFSANGAFQKPKPAVPTKCSASCEARARTVSRSGGCHGHLPRENSRKSLSSASDSPPSGAGPMAKRTTPGASCTQARPTAKRFQYGSAPSAKVSNLLHRAVANMR